MTKIDQVRYFIKAAEAILLVNSIINADPKVFRTEKTPSKVRRAREKRGRPGARAKSWITLPGLRYKDGHWSAPAQGGGVAWHMVRGHPRHLTSDRYTNKKGMVVWVKPYPKGSKDLGVSNTPYRLK